MSEFLAEARILVRPDTSRFRADLEAQLASVVRTPVKIPVIPVAGAGFAAAAAGSSAFAAAQKQATAATTVSADALAAATTIQKQYKGSVLLSAAATETLAAAQTAEAAAAAKMAAANAAANAATQAGLRKGVIAQLASLLGLRAGTLAASSAFIAGTVAVLGFAKAVQSAANLETELNVFRVNASATADEMERVSEAAKDLGRDVTLPGVTAGNAAVAMTELAKAGLSVEDSLTGARGALQLATAANIDVTQSTEIVANTLNAFGLAGSDAVKVADLLAGAAKSAQGEIGEFGTALGQVASVADQFGVSAADTVTLLTQLAKAGLQGGRAGTTLRVAILGLIKPTAAAAVELDKLKKAGVEITDPRTGAFNPTAFAQINDALQKYSKEQQNVVRNTIFSSDAIKVLGRATAGGVTDFENINRSVTEAGLAQELAGARTQGFNGDVANLKNQVETLGLTVGQVAKGPVGLLVKVLGGAAGAINDTTAAAEKKGVFETFGQAVGDFASSFERLSLGFNRAVIASTQASTQFSIFDGIARGVTVTTDALADALERAAAAVAANQGLPKDSGLNVKQVQNVVAGFEEKETKDKIAKNTKQLLADLQAERDFLIAQLQRQYVKNRPALRRALEQALLGTNNEIDSIDNKAKSDTAKIAADAKSNASKAVQALLSGQATAREEAQNRIAAAGQSAGLQDDIKAQQGLRALVLKQIAAVKARVSVEGGRAAALAALNGILIQIDGQTKELISQQRQAAADRRAAVLQGIDLDVQLAQITDNQAAEVAARNKKIGLLNAQLKEEAKLHGKTTVHYKEIRNQIAQETAAIAAITKEQQKQNSGLSFAQATFSFLQDQQGFASSLLGNLIPTGSQGGLVGGGSPVQQALTPVADTTGKSGPTSGQANATNSILARILEQLKVLNGSQAAPEANRQNAWQRSTMDYHS